MRHETKGAIFLASNLSGFNRHVSRENYPLTNVPTFSPVTTLNKVPGVSISKTIIGSSFSMHKVKAVISITLKFFAMQSAKVIVSNFSAEGSFSGSAV